MTTTLSRAADKNSPARLRWLRLCCGLFALAVLLAGYLAWVALSGGAVAGCGIESSCDRVLQSRWAWWLGIPVSLPALAVYVALLAAGLRRTSALRASDQPRGGWWVVALAGVVIVAAIWFVLLQVVVIRAFCTFCLAAHLSAVGGATILIVDARRHRSQKPVSRQTIVNSGLAGLAGIVLLIGGQLLFVKPMNRISAIEAPAIESSSATVVDRILSLHDGRIKLNLQTSPRIGSPSAPHIVVCLFDYTCPHCRSLHELLDRAWQRSDGQLTIVTLPVPLDASCNRLVQQTSTENLNACEYARLALAVWKAKPDAFPQFHSWLFASPRPPALREARQYAGNLVSAATLRQAMDEEWVKRQVQMDVELFEANNKRAGVSQLPQLMAGQSLSVGPINSAEGLDLLLQEQFGKSITH